MERRRAQNRMAQRRFRERHQEKAISHRQSQTQTLSNDTLRNSDLPTQELSRAPQTSSAEFSTSFDTAADPPEAFCGLSIPGTHTHLNNISFMDIENIYSLDLDPKSTSITALQPPTETGKRILHKSTDRDSSIQSESASGRKECDSFGPIVNSLSEHPQRKASWLGPLHIAAQKGHDRIVRLLLQHNADCNEKDSDGLTPLIHATIGGHEGVVCLLLLNGASVGNVDGNRRSALHWAVMQRHEALLKHLLDRCLGEQAIVDEYDKDGMTPLHIAVDSGFEAGVQILLQFGASVYFRARKSR